MIKKIFFYFQLILLHSCQYLPAILEDAEAVIEATESMEKGIGVHKNMNPNQD